MDWMIPVNQCRLSDVIQTHNIDGLTIGYPNLGACNPPEIIQLVCRTFQYSWDNRETIGFISALIDLGLHYKELKNWIENKFLNKCNSVNVLIKSLTHKSCTSKAEFKFEYDIEDDSFAEAALYFLGYLYDSKTDLYFYNKDLMNRNINEFKKIYHSMEQ